jgi:hypothetical protein
MTLRRCIFKDISFNSVSTSIIPSLYIFYGPATVNFYDCCFKNLSGGLGSPLFSYNTAGSRSITFSHCEFDDLRSGNDFSIIHLNMTAGSSSFIFEHNTVKNIEAYNSQSVNGTFLRLSENYNILTISENRFENISGKGAGGVLSFELSKQIVIESCMLI